MAGVGIPTDVELKTPEAARPNYQVVVYEVAERRHLADLLA